MAFRRVTFSVGNSLKISTKLLPYQSQEKEKLEALS